MTQDYDHDRELCDDKREELRTDLMWLKGFALKLLSKKLIDIDDFHRFNERLQKISSCARL